MKRIIQLSLAFAVITLGARVGICADGQETTKAAAVKGSIVNTRPLVQHRKTPAILRLEHDDGFPVMADELEIVHTRPVHLLAVDPSLSDYHHTHPMPMNKPGNYIFTLTPGTPCGYRIWADIDPASAGRQYVTADISGAKDCSGEAIDRTPSMEYEENGHRFLLAFEPPELRVGQETTIKLTVRRGKAGFVDELEAYMGAFAHLVGFYDDYRTVAHIHPLGDAPSSFSDRGGPRLKFHYTPEREGFVRLFMQVQIGGHVITAPFGVTVLPADISDNIAAIQEIMGTIGNDAATPDKEQPDGHGHEGHGADHGMQNPASGTGAAGGINDILAIEAEMQRREQQRSGGQEGLEALYSEPQAQDGSLYEDTSRKVIEETAGRISDQPFPAPEIQADPASGEPEYPY